MILYFDVDKRHFFRAPQFTRQNHRYHGPRESEKINLEVSQFYFSVKKLYQEVNDFETKYIQYIDDVLEGRSLGIEVDMFDQGAEDTFGSPVSVDLEGLNNLMGRIIQLESRINALEN